MRRSYIVIVALFSIICIAVIFCGQIFFPYTEVSAVYHSMNESVLIIDPGHGGEDGGTVSALGRKESDVNLSIGKKMASLAHLLGMRAIMSRTEDCSLQTSGGSFLQRKTSDLKNRVALVNATPNALLVSIHQNHFTDSRYFGAQVFYAASKESNLLAQSIQKNLIDFADPANHRKCKPAQGIYLLERVSCTAVLVECGFFSNPEEEEKLHDSDYQKKLSLAIMAAVANYQGEADV